MKSEQKIQTEIIKYLESIGGYCIKTMVSNSMGVPDIICCLNGEFYGIEVKKENGVVSKMQHHHLNKISASGGYGFIARSVKDVKAYIGEVQES